MKKHLKLKKNKLKKSQLLMSILSGILLSFSFSILSLDWLAWLALTPLFYALYKFRNKKRYHLILSFIFSFSFYLGTLFWLFKLYPMDWMGFSNLESFLLIASGWIGFSLIESIGLTFVGAATAFSKPKGFNRIIIPTLAWVSIEYFQSLGTFGFTWGRLANSQFQNISLIQSSSLFGSLFITGLIVFVNLCLVNGIIELTNNNKKQSIKYVLSAFIVFIANYGYGKYSTSNFKDEGKTINAAIIQGNIASDEKWKPGKDLEALELYLDMSEEIALENNNIDLFVWPESAIPVFMSENHKFMKRLKQFSYILGPHLITGTFTAEKKNEKDYDIYNSIIAISPDEKILGSYRKRHLVPFGEFLPFRDTIKKIAPGLSQINALANDLTPGKDTRIIKSKLGNIGGIICYESIFPKIVSSSVNDGAELIVVVTNDSWYKDSMGVYQHNAQSVMRAVENQRYILRAANTGISSVISPTGKIIDYIDPLVKDHLISKVKTRNNITLYTKIGDVIAYLSIILLPILILLSRRKKEDDL